MNLPHIDICRVWVSEPGVTGHTCCNPLPCPIHTRLPNPAHHARDDGRDNLSQGLPDDDADSAGDTR